MRVGIHASKGAGGRAELGGIAAPRPCVGAAHAQRLLTRSSGSPTARRRFARPRGRPAPPQRPRRPAPQRCAASHAPFVRKCVPARSKRRRPQISAALGWFAGPIAINLGADRAHIRSHSGRRHCWTVAASALFDAASTAPAGQAHPGSKLGARRRPLIRTATPREAWTATWHAPSRDLAEHQLCQDDGAHSRRVWAPSFFDCSGPWRSRYKDTSR
jgi:hypothetical protein